VNDVLRPITEADLPELYELARRVEIHDQIPFVTPWEEFEEVKDDPHTDLATDSIMVIRDERAIAYGRVWHRPPGDADHARAFVVGGVDPSFRRQGVGSLILEWTINRAREVLATAPPNLDKFIRTFAFDFEHEAIALYERHALKPIRYFADLLRPLTQPMRVPQPEGVRVLPWDESRSEEIRTTLNLAFRDHWGSTPLDEKAWEHRVRGTGMRLDMSYIALADDEVVAACLNGHFPDDQKVTGRLDGIIQTLGTHPDYRKRGIASALIETSCQRFFEEGWDHAILGVDSENPTGAFRLYQGLGFEPLHRMIQHQLQV
jgi:ribosomal protein S18 acetylase RimI-like enzyme